MLNFFRNGEEELGREGPYSAIYFCWFEAIMGFSLEKRVGKPAVFL